jgi:hypothetical protein
MPGRVGCEPGAAEEPERCARKRALTSSFQAAGLGERGGAGDGAAAAVGAGGRLETEALKVILFQQFSVDRVQRVRRSAFRSLTDGAPGAESDWLRPLRIWPGRRIRDATLRAERRLNECNKPEREKKAAENPAEERDFRVRTKPQRANSENAGQTSP